MKSKFKKLMAAALVLCLVLALLPAAAFANDDGTDPAPLTPDEVTFTYENFSGGNFGPDGTGYTYGEITVAENENSGYTLTATPDAGYGLKLLSINDEDVTITADPGEDFTYDFGIGLGTTSVIIKASFNQVFEVDVADMANGSVTPDKAKAFEDDIVTLTISPETGYAISGDGVKVEELNGIPVTVSDTVGSKCSFKMPAANVFVSADFVEATIEPEPEPETYTVTCWPAENGDLLQDNTRYKEGDIVTIAYLPDKGYRLASMRALAYGDSGNILWNEDITETNSFEMPASNVVVFATFEPAPNTYTIGTNVTGKGSVTVSPTGPVAEGEWVTVTATPAEGYKLAALRYFVDGETCAPENVTSGVPFRMPGYNITVNAVFVPVSGEYAINVTTDGGCTVSQPVSAAYGDYVTIDIVMNSGYHLYNVYLDNELVTDDVYWYNGQWHYSFYMPNHDVDIYVTTTTKYFVNPVYNIDGGAVEVWVKDAGGWDSTIFADKGDWVCFKASPYSGYELGSVSVTGRWSNQSYDVHYNKYDGCYYFKMPGESVDLSVSFVDGQHRVYVKDVSNGSLTANVNWAAEGDKVYVTAKPSKGYELTWLSVKAADGTVLKIYEALGENTYYFYMPDQYVTVSGIFSLISSGLPFVDVNSGAWYYDAVSFVYNKGIMNGVTSTTFEPNSTITRGMVVTMLWRMAGEPYVSGGSFSDVASGRYYSTAVAWAAKNGIVDGYSSTVFGVNDPVTREQFATILYRYAKYMGYSTTGSSLTGYYDANSVSSWARDAMGWAVRNGIITGSGNSRLNPTGTASRAEVAQMFMSFYEFTT